MVEWKRVLMEQSGIEGSIGHGGLTRSKMHQRDCLGIHMGIGCTSAGQKASCQA